MQSIGKKVLLVYEAASKERYANLLKQIEEIFLEKEMYISHVCFEKEELEQEYIGELTDNSVDYICTLDLVGFQIDTVLDIPAYNVIAAKQIHIVIKQEVMELYGDYDMALNLYLYLPDAEDTWKDKYPHIPNLEIYPGFEMDEQDILTLSAYNTTVLKNIIEGMLQDAVY